MTDLHACLATPNPHCPLRTEKGVRRTVVGGGARVLVNHCRRRSSKTVDDADRRSGARSTSFEDVKNHVSIKKILKISLDPA